MRTGPPRLSESDSGQAKDIRPCTLRPKPNDESNGDHVLIQAVLVGLRRSVVRSFIEEGLSQGQDVAEAQRTLFGE